VTIVALGLGSYRADVTFRGLAAPAGAAHLQERLRRQRLACDAWQDSDGGWTVRVGPAEAGRLLRVLRDVLG